MAQIVPDQYLQLTREQLIALSYIYNQYELFQMILTDPQYALAMRQIGFVPSAGTWNDVKTFIASAEESVKTALPAVGTATTALVNTVRPVTGVTAAHGTSTVTTSGILTATSTSVGAVACAGALGFVTGVNAFEAAPEAWTKLSNLVFGTDLDPTEIGELARNTNALVMIKDGVCYMAEDLVTAIRDALFDIGAASDTVELPKLTAGRQLININTYGGAAGVQALYAEFVELMKKEMGSTSFEPWSDYAKQIVAEINSGLYNNAVIEVLYPKNGGYNTEYRFAVRNITQALPTINYVNVYDTDYGVGGSVDEDSFINSTSGKAIYIYKSGGVFYDDSMRGLLSNRVGIPAIGEYRYSYPRNPAVYDRYAKGIINVETKPAVDGIAPTGEQGTKEQTLDEVFPDWVAKAVTTLAGLEAVRRWFPVSIPSTDPATEAYPYTTPVAQEGLLPQLDTDPLLQLLTNPVPDATAAEDFPAQPTPLPQPTPPTTETPEVPSISGGGGSATGLANLYNPTLAQVKQFSRWLWGSDGLNLDQLKKLLQDPMQAIIGLHVMYATPATGATRDIQVGYINSGVQSKIVTEQYTEIDCGTVTINEYFGDARDYSPYTQVYCYLPFIGIVELNADDVVNSSLGIKYKIDVLTGCCLAQLTVKKYGLDAVLYTYTGNCAVQMPITSGNYLSTVSSLLGAVVSGAAAVATGGALAPVAIGAAANAMGGGARASVAMSGSLGSNAGAMGIRKPYLIIKRVESADANGYNEFYGYPTNKRVNLSQLTGYVRVKEINLSGTNATEDEQNEIVALLKEGVIL